MTQEWKRRFTEARRAVIAAQFASLNPMQRQGVLTTEGPLLLLAGAGSGKTTVLIHRIANLIRFGCGSDSDELPPFAAEADADFLERYAAAPTEEDRARAENLCRLRTAEPWQIIAITFTNKAANQLKDRLASMLGERGQEVWAMTFHSACCRILRRYIDRLGYDRSFVIYDTADSQHVIKDAIAELRLDEKSFPPRTVLTLISRAKDRMQSPDDFAADASAAQDYRLERIAEVYRLYQKQLRRSNALDFDDILLLTVKLLQQDGEVREHYQNQFRYVLVDEYQDTNRVQYLLASLLAGEKRNICVVGDDDQSIYKFRGATIENILDFEKRYPGARVIRLEQNYRSTAAILKTANEVISHNAGRKGKTLWTKKTEGEKIRIYNATDESDEASFVAGSIIHDVRDGCFRDCAVLYRTNAQSNALEYAFQRNAIPYRIIGGRRFFDRAEIKDLLAYLYLINDHADDFHLIRILNNPPRGIGEKTLELAQRQADAAGKPLFEVLSDAGNYPSLERAREKLLRFAALITECTDLLETETLPDFYERVLEKTGYLLMLEQKDDPESLTRADNIRELKSSIVNYCEGSDHPTLAGFLEEVALFTDIEQYDADADAVVMMTIHSAKGLEFPNVYLVGLEEGLFPGGAASGDPDELEEERRLCYVAITRAMKRLTLSYADHRMLYGRTNSNRPSRFLFEMPDDCTVGKPRRKPQGFGSDYGLAAECVIPSGQSTYRKKDYSALTGQKTSAPPKIELRCGDMVEHKAFGRGMVLTVQPMGNDALLEVAFDGIGTKKLMANAAAPYLKKK